MSTTDGGAVTKNVGVSKTQIRFPFRKLEKLDDDDDDDDNDEDAEDNDDNDDDDEEQAEIEDENDSDEKIESDIYKNYKFTKVRRPTLEVKKKREDLRYSKLAQFRDNDSDEDDDENGENESNDSIFSRILNFFKGKKSQDETTKDDSNDSGEDEDEKEDGNDSGEIEDQENGNENKPLLTELFDKFKSFLEARNQDRSALKESDEDDGDSSKLSHVLIGVNK